MSLLDHLTRDLSLREQGKLLGEAGRESDVDGARAALQAARTQLRQSPAFEFVVRAATAARVLSLLTGERIDLAAALDLNSEALDRMAREAVDDGLTQLRTWS